MSIQTQKIIRFIPIVNLITLVLLCIKYLSKPLKDTNFFKVMLIMAGIVIGVNIPRMILVLIFDNVTLSHITYCISLYATTLGISWVAVAEQEKMENENMDRRDCSKNDDPRFME